MTFFAFQVPSVSLGLYIGDLQNDIPIFGWIDQGRTAATSNTIYIFFNWIAQGRISATSNNIYLFLDGLSKIEPWLFRTRFIYFWMDRQRSYLGYLKHDVLFLIRLSKV